MVRRSPREREVAGSIPGRVIPKTLKSALLTAALPNAWHLGDSGSSSSSVEAAVKL